jgi:hypothetical protein
MVKVDIDLLVTHVMEMEEFNVPVTHVVVKEKLINVVVGNLKSLYS